MHFGRFFALDQAKSRNLKMMTRTQNGAADGEGKGGNGIRR